MEPSWPPDRRLLIHVLRCLGQGWTWRMAWRDSRQSRPRLFLYSTSIILGIAALTAIGSFGDHMKRGIEEQARTLLGADLVVTARDPFSGEAETLVRSLGGEQAREVSFSSMVVAPGSGATRLAQVRALSGGFPFYGAFETNPRDAARRFRETGGALLEGSLASQLGVGAGDQIKIGELVLSVQGVLEKAPGETIAFSTIAPRVYLPLAELPKAKLLGESSLARYRVYFRFDERVNVPALERRIRPELDRLHLESTTVEERKRDLGRSLSNLYSFLNLVGFVALLLGGVGVASAIHVHIRQKIPTIAILRCLGSSSSQAFAVYLVQALVLGIVGAVAGALLGLVIQAILPKVLADFVPVQMDFGVSWLALLRGMGLGMAICVLFALLPLLAVRRVSPLAAIRSGVDSEKTARDPLLWFCHGIIVLGVVLFGLAQSSQWRYGLGFSAGLLAAFGVLLLAARSSVWVLRRILPAGLPYVCRQGVANLYRPQNRTVLMTLALGLGTFLVLTLHLVQTSLMRELFPAERGSQANAILFDIQPDQVAGVTAVLRGQGLDVLENAPIVTMRLQSVKERAVEEIKRDKSHSIPGWVLNREYRSTHRERLTPTERLVQGEWIARVPEGTTPVPVSIEDGIAERLELKLGDRLVFDVQGVPLESYVASIREVDWRRLHPNFFVVFPAGVLDEAPAFHVFATRVPGAEESARMQRQVVKEFPNVSIIDLGLVLRTIDSLLERIGFVLQFMSLFTVGTGVLVLAGALLTGRFQRVQENVLLRMLGASRSQVLLISAVEYLSLGLLASSTGILLAIGGTWALSAFVFNTGFAVTVGPPLIALGLVCLLTVLMGLLMNRGMLNQPPLEILRSSSEM